MRARGYQVEHEVPYHPASNGVVAERAIGVLTNIVRAMLHHSGLPKFLWAEAFSTTTYVHTRTPTRALDGLIPHEVLYSTKTSPTCVPSARPIVEPAEKLRKLDNRARMCFFVGYKYSGGGYRVCDPEKKAIVEYRDVAFFEDGLPSPPLHSSPMPSNDNDEAA